MAKKRSEEKEIEEAISLGQENARLYPKVQNWCRHLEIRMHSAGMLAQWYRLPIGQMEIVCEHASGLRMQAMQLHHVATSFILNNCRDCPFHETKDIDNIGILILREADRLAEVKNENHTDAEGDRRTQLKKELESMVSGDLHQVLEQSEITTQSILKLVALLDDEADHIEAARKLERASEVAPDLFNNLAIEILCSNFLHSDHGAYCIQAVRNLVKGCKELPQMTSIAAEMCLSEHRNADEACALIGDLVEHRGYTPTSEKIDEIIKVQQHGHFFGLPGSSHRDFPGSRHALKEIGKCCPTSLENALRKRFSINDKLTRINAAHVLVSLLDEIPGIGNALIDSLINSLELDDDPYEESADATACMAIAAIYVREPVFTQGKIELGYKHCSAEAKALLYAVFRYIAMRPNWLFVEEETHLTQYEDCIPAVISHLLSVIGGLGYSLEVKRSAVDAFEIVTRHNPEMLIPHLDVIIGTLANVVQEEILLSEKSVNGDLAQLEKQSQQTQLESVRQCITEALIAVAELEPRSVLTRAKEIVSRLVSSNQQQAWLKAELAKVFGYLGRKHELLPEIVPVLYKLLMDFDSVIVRGMAVEAIGEILKNQADALPENMLDMIIYYLNDSYVYIHKKATHSIRSLIPANFEQANNIASRLLVLDYVYQNEQNELYFRQEILKSILYITKGFPNLLESLTVPLILKRVQLKDSHFAENALMDFYWLLPSLPNRYATIFGKEVIEYLARSKRNLYNNEQFTGRYHLYSYLFNLSRKDITQVLEVAKASALRNAKDDPWDALKMVQLLTYFEFHIVAAELATAIANEQPKTKKYEQVVQECVIEGSLAAAEEMVIKGRPDLAIKVLEEAAQLVARRDSIDENERFKDVVDAFTVADTVSKQLKLVQGL